MDFIDVYYTVSMFNVQASLNNEKHQIILKGVLSFRERQLRYGTCLNELQTRHYK